MAVLKCKMCGGDIILSEDKTFGTCDSCGSTMTFPKVSDEHKLNLYNRANHFRRQNEFDKAIAAYDKILDQDDTDAEAHWGAVLSRYGIEYVEDPVSHERIPTCHRVQAASILSDPDYLSALEYAPDTVSRALYEQEARRIAEIQKGILAISSQEKPYDVFICYKETDAEGRRTRDSALAQEIYYQLTNEGYKVFFSRITLEDKLGQEYEPYIFAALNSAKVMLVIGTKPEFFNAVWVKNEWSRYLALMKNDRSRLLIPCYRDMDPYDLPEELSALQSQDMSKIGFIQDITRGIKKVLAKPEAKPQPAAVQQAPAAAANVENLMKRVRLFMEDGDFDSANEYLDKVLDEDAEYAPAYVAKVCTTLGFRWEEQLAEATFLYDEHPDWIKALRFASPQQKSIYEGYYEKVKARVEQQIQDYTLDCAMELAVNPGADQKKLLQELEQYKLSCASFGSNRSYGSRRNGAEVKEAAFLKAVQENEPGDITEKQYKNAAELLQNYADESFLQRKEQCMALAKQAQLKAVYLDACNDLQRSHSAIEYEKLAEKFIRIAEYKDASAKAERCLASAEAQRKADYDEIKKAIVKAGNSKSAWKEIQTWLNNPDLDNYLDVKTLRAQAAKRYDECVAAEKEAQLRQLLEAEAAAAKKKRSTILGILAAVVVVAAVLVVTLVIIPGNNYRNAVALQQAGKYEDAITAFEALNGYGDSAAQIEACQNGIKERDYQAALALLQAGKYEEAIEAFTALSNYSDAVAQITETRYLQAKDLTSKGDYARALAIFIGIKGYKDVDSLLINNRSLAAAVAARDAKYSVGNYVTFGHYPQTSAGNDNTMIGWLVLARDGNKALLISRRGLDAKPYDENKLDTTWEKCTLRTWLNGTFLNKAFTAQEQTGILTTNVENSSSQGYSDWSTSGGNNTQDKVFLLSYAEANEYFGALRLTWSGGRNNTESRVAPTAYAIKQGAFTSSTDKTSDGYSAGEWWLRSPGSEQYYALNVLYDGSLNINYLSNSNVCVRPALWIDLSSDIF